MSDAENSFDADANRLLQQLPALEAQLAQLFGDAWHDPAVVMLRAVEGAPTEWMTFSAKHKASDLRMTTLFSWCHEHVQAPHVELGLPGGAKLSVMRLADDRVAVAVSKSPHDVSTQWLEQQQLWPAGVAGDVVSALQQGHSVVVVGGHWLTRDASMRALCKQLREQQLSVWGVGGLRSHQDGDVMDAATAWGADVIAVDEHGGDAAEWLARRPSAPLLLSANSHVDVCAASLRRHHMEASSVVWVVLEHAWPGRVVELRMPAGLDVETTPATSNASTVPTATTTTTMSSAPQIPMLASSMLPTKDVDPGWELAQQAALPPAVAPRSDFERALANAAAPKPHRPHPPPAHPMMQTLQRGTGGLTFEPPGNAFGFPPDGDPSGSADNNGDVDVAPMLPTDDAGEP
jgi:hypothetical protein